MRHAAIPDAGDMVGRRSGCITGGLCSDPSPGIADGDGCCRPTRRGGNVCERLGSRHDAVKNQVSPTSYPVPRGGDREQFPFHSERGTGAGAARDNPRSAQRGDTATRSGDRSRTDDPARSRRDRYGGTTRIGQCQDVGGSITGTTIHDRDAIDAIIRYEKGATCVKIRRAHRDSELGRIGIETRGDCRRLSQLYDLRRGAVGHFELVCSKLF